MAKGLSSPARAGRYRAAVGVGLGLVVILLLRSAPSGDEPHGRRLWGHRSSDGPEHEGLGLGDFFGVEPSGPGTCQQLAARFLAANTAQHDYCLRKPPQKPDDVEVVELAGPSGEPLQFMVYEDEDAVSRHVRKRGKWEPHLLSALTEAMDRASVLFGLPKSHVALLDVGANVGVHTTYMQAAGYKVVAFEPMPSNEQVLRHNLCLHDPGQQRVVLFTKGLGSRAGLCRMYSHAVNRGNGVVYCDGGPIPPPRAGGHMRPRGTLEMTTLDDALLCREKGRGGRSSEGPGLLPWRFGAVKMDVEGFEPQVLAGGRRFLREWRVPFVMMEWVEEGNRPRPQEELQGMLDLMYGLGYLASTSGFFAQDLGRPPLEAVMAGRTMFFVLQDAAGPLSAE